MITCIANVLNTVCYEYATIAHAPCVLLASDAYPPATKTETPACSAPCENEPGRVEECHHTLR